METSNLNLLLINSGDDFWSLISELYNDNSGFIYNKSTLVEAYGNGNLYGLYSKNYSNDESELFCSESSTSNLLPCFCVCEGNKAMIMWVHTRARRRGLGRTLIELLDIKVAYKAMKESYDFWKACKVNYLSDIADTIKRRKEFGDKVVKDFSPKIKKRKSIC